MSRKTAKTSSKTAVRKQDPRVLRTRDVLGDALVALMHEKPFEEITVQHVLDRAGVSRSTFYTHYSDKNDLFLGDVEDFWELMSTILSRHGDKSNRVAPVRELFAHLAEAREFYAALVASGKVYEVMELGQGYFARAIEKRLVEWEAGSPRPAGQAARPSSAVMAQMFAGALFSLLTWWVNQGMPGSPAEMDTLYHQMVWRALSAPGGNASSVDRRSKNAEQL